MFGGLRKRIIEPQIRTEAFFCAAVSAFAQEADENAYYAAFVTGVVVHPTARRNFITYLASVAGSISVQKPKLAERLNRLAVVLSSRPWGFAEERPMRDSLKTKDQEYWLAYCHRDAAVFKTKYPDLHIVTFGDVVPIPAQTRQRGSS